MLRAEMQGLTDEHEVEVERLNAQIKKLRDDARSARESTGSEEKMVAAVREECDAVRGSISFPRLAPEILTARPAATPGGGHRPPL